MVANENVYMCWCSRHLLMATKLRTVKGNNISLEVKLEKGLTVADVKKLISAREQIPPDQQHLWFNNVELKENQDVSSLRLGEIYLITQQDLSLVVAEPGCKFGDPAWEQTLRLAAQLEQEEAKHFQETHEADQDEASLLLAQELQQAEDARVEEAKRDEELSLQFAKQLQQEEEVKQAEKLSLQFAKSVQKEGEVQGVQERQAERKEPAVQMEDAEEEEKYVQAWQELQRRQQFELDSEDEKLRVQEDQQRFHQTQVARNQDEADKLAAKNELLQRQEGLDQSLSLQLETAEALSERSQEAERKLDLARQAHAQELAEQEQVRAAVRAEIARQEQARLAAIRASSDPNLYLYPAADACSQGGYLPVSVKVKLAPYWVVSVAEPVVAAGGLNTSGATWNVSVNSQGKLRDQNGQPCRYIKYDMATLDSYTLQSKFGLHTSNTFCVSVRDYKAFFERALRRLGLEGDEISDMIAFCQPTMEVSEWTNITFLSASVYNELVDLSIRPAPQQVVRVFAVLRNVPGWDASAKATLDSLPTPPIRDDRKFVAVEWGATDASKWDAISSILRAKLKEEEDAARIRELEQQAAQDAERLRELRSRNNLSSQAVKQQERVLREREAALRSLKQSHANERASFRSQGLYFGR
eukprot:g14013.t1